MQYVRVKVKRDPQMAVVNLFPRWEIPMLKYTFEDGNVEELDSEEVARDYPNAAAEYSRFVKVYGADSKSGIPHVVSVYGEGSRGVRSLQEAIDEAKLADQPAPKARKSREAAADPLTN
jgi:hypothetical protein